LNHILTAVPVAINTKATESVRSTVTNLSSHKPDFTTKLAQTIVIQEFQLTYNDFQVVVQKDLTEQELLNIEEVRKNVQGLQSWDWIYGMSPGFNAQINKTFPFGEIVMDTHVKDGVISDLQVSITPSKEDSQLDLQSNVASLTLGNLSAQLQNCLVHCKFRKAFIANRFKEFLQEHYPHLQQQSQLQNLLQEQEKDQFIAVINWYLDQLI